MQKKRTTTFFSILILPVFFSGLFAGISPCQETKPAAATIEFWSVFDDSDVYKPLIEAFQKQYSYITVVYKKKDIATYEQELLDALASGKGPDIFSIHNTWLPKHENKLYPAPEALVTVKKYKETFADVAAKDFIDNDKIYAFPFSIDTLALFYNKELLSSAGIAKPPETWSDFNTAVEKITKRDAKNNITLAGAAIGTAKNINRSTDILSVLMLQSGVKMVSDDESYSTMDKSSSSSDGKNYKPAEQAFLFYTSFANPSKKVYTWNKYQHYSSDAFVEGKAAMMFSYAYQIPVVVGKAPHLDFAIAPLPQISKDGTRINYANYWGQAVSKTSKNPGYAWQFIAWMSSAENIKKYSETTKKPPSRLDLVDSLKGDQDIGVFTEQILTAKSWLQPDNAAVEQLFATSIENIVDNKIEITDAVKSVTQQLTQMLRENANSNYTSQ